MGLTKAYARIEELEQENAQLRLQIDMLKMERENDGWIPCSERMPEEHQEEIELFDGIYNTMTSDEVNVTYISIDGTRRATVSTSSDGEWSIPGKVIAWKTIEPYKGDTDATK